MTDCRDRKDNKYLERALAAGAPIIVSSDDQETFSPPPSLKLLALPAPRRRVLAHDVEEFLWYDDDYPTPAAE